MELFTIAIPLLVLAVIVGLPVHAALLRRPMRSRSPRVRRTRRSALRVSQGQMDQDLQDLIRRRS